MGGAVGSAFGATGQEKAGLNALEARPRGGQGGPQRGFQAAGPRAPGRRGPRSRSLRRGWALEQERGSSAQKRAGLFWATALPTNKGGVFIRGVHKDRGLPRVGGWLSLVSERHRLCPVGLRHEGFEAAPTHIKPGAGGFRDQADSAVPGADQARTAPLCFERTLSTDKGTESHRHR